MRYIIYCSNPKKLDRLVRLLEPLAGGVVEQYPPHFIVSESELAHCLIGERGEIFETCIPAEAIERFCEEAREMARQFVDIDEKSP